MPQVKRETRSKETRSKETPSKDAISQATAASTLPNFTTDLPTYFPVHSSLRLNTEMSQGKGLKQIEEKINSLNKVVDKFLAYVVKNPHLFQDDNTQLFLKTQSEAYGELLESKFKLATLANTIKQANREIVETRIMEGDLSLENYESFRNVQKQNFGDSMISKIENALESKESLKQALQDDPTYQYLSHVTFVMLNPEDPLPDDSVDEDLAVSGGKISLKDPLSMDYFVEPVLSQKCKHVYENKYIRQQLQGHSEIDCPITGCSAKLGLRDLKEDKLMALRVKVFQAGVKKREQRVRI